MAQSGIGDGWHPARLIPTAGIRGQDEQEKRATSSLLAVMRAVPEFGHALLGPLGAPRGRISTYAEPQIKDPTGKLHIPDGAIVVERGRSVWRCLVEVKTGTAELQADQVNRYLDWARENPLDGVLTISNQITASHSDSPVPVDGRKLRNTWLYHLSWWRILTEAIVQHRHRGVSDPDQAWLLDELIAYLDNERSGASGFQDMGENWVRVRDGAGDGTLRASDPEVRDIAERWEQFVEYLCLGLGQDLGRDVRVVRPRKQTTAARLDANASALAQQGALEAAIRVPDAVGPVVVQADLRMRRVITSVTVEAPGEGRPLTRVSWLVRQLKDAPDGLVVDVNFVNTKTTTAGLLSAAREHPHASSSPTIRSDRRVRSGLRSRGRWARSAGRGSVRSSWRRASRRSASIAISSRTCGHGALPRRSFPPSRMEHPRLRRRRRSRPSTYMRSHKATELEHGAPTAWTQGGSASVSPVATVVSSLPATGTIPAGDAEARAAARLARTDREYCPALYRTLPSHRSERACSSASC